MTPGAEQFDFGSSHRAGRDDPRYQVDRLSRFCRFQCALVEAQRERLVLQERRGREVWLAKEELERLSAARAGRIDELEAWTDELSSAKEHLEGRVAELERWVENREGVIRAQDELKAALDAEIARLTQQVRERERALAEQSEQSSAASARAQEALAAWKRQRLFRALRRVGLLRDLTVE